MPPSSAVDRGRVEFSERSARALSAVLLPPITREARATPCPAFTPASYNGAVAGLPLGDEAAAWIRLPARRARPRLWAAPWA